MMNIGFVGLGKLGLPVAVSIAMRGHKVIGYDVDKKRMTKDPQNYKESGPAGQHDFNDYLATADNLHFGSIQDVVKQDIIFVAVQTPHNPKYEGITPLPKDRENFEYSYLMKAVVDIRDHLQEPKPVVIISTVLPTTMKERIFSIIEGSNIRLIYNPFFIAMGTVMKDFLSPEFILIGANKENAEYTMKLVDFYRRLLSGVNIIVMSIESAELTKVIYNTFISMKIGYANTVMEICEKIDGANVDDVLSSLTFATDRIISPKYLQAGMGDGGACHPRDNIALSWLARKLKLSTDVFEDIMMWREGQARYLANMLYTEHLRTSLPICILGYAFKSNTNITTGSHALLVYTILKDEYCVDVMLRDDNVSNESEQGVDILPAVFLIGCLHDRYKRIQLHQSSVVIDPFGIVDDPLIRCISIGR